ncbi:MAG: tripartite tricarboxylate transporter TctB family protein [Zoogloeaceae bacterium]|jgi:hypothetical protein|nr:tripartite tricarboxylate transporter TctB family protein [Zoogloeaceae bacterium]
MRHLITDIFAGHLFCAAGLATMTAALRHPVGSAMRMGAGIFPLILGGLLAFFGLIVFSRSAFRLCRRGSFSFAVLAKAFTRAFSLRTFFPAVLVGAGMLAFVGLLSAFGFVCAVLVLVIVSGFAHHEARWREILPLSLGMAFFGVGVFVWGLNLPLRVLPI